MTRLTALVSTNQELTRFVKFAMVGTLGALVDFGVLNLLVLVFGWDEKYANLVSVSCAIVSNFVWNRVWTFPESRDRSVHTQFGQFALVNLIGLGINELVFLTTDALIFSSLVAHPLDYNLAKVVATIVVLFWNFGANRRWTYKGI